MVQESKVRGNRDNVDHQSICLLDKVTILLCDCVSVRDRATDDKKTGGHGHLICTVTRATVAMELREVKTIRYGTENKM